MSQNNATLNIDFTDPPCAVFLIHWIGNDTPVMNETFDVSNNQLVTSEK